MMISQEENRCYNSNLDYNQTISHSGVENLVLGLEECEILTRSHQQPHVPNGHKKKPTIRLTTRITMLWAHQRPLRYQLLRKKSNAMLNPSMCKQVLSSVMYAHVVGHSS